MPKVKYLTRFAAVLSISSGLLSFSVSAQDLETNVRIVTEGTDNSQVMDIARELSDDIGARLPNSPQMRAAEQWALDKFNSWNLDNVHKDGFEFGRGWSITSSHAQMIEPRGKTLSAIPVAWTPATDGTITAPVVFAPIEQLDDLKSWQGKLNGKIVLISKIYPYKGDDDLNYKRFTDEDFARINQVEQKKADRFTNEDIFNYADYLLIRDMFYSKEGAKALVQMSWADNMWLQGFGFTHKKDASATVPTIEMAAEDYRRLARMIEAGQEPVLSIDSNVQFYDEDSKTYNIIADIKGSDDSGEYIMAGAHMDSWVSGDGATDNAAGVSVVMEAARIIKASGVQPKRTIRFALWAAEEQGLLGSQNYAEQYLGTVQASADNEETPTLVKKPGYDLMKAYFNIDNGSGKIRGIYGEWEEGARPLLQRWLAPFETLDAHRVAISGVGGTDHVSFQVLGLPGYQFIQDPLDYDSTTHHNNTDTYEHLSPEDLKQAAIVMAGVLMAAANDDETLPVEGIK